MYLVVSRGLAREAFIISDRTMKNVLLALAVFCGCATAQTPSAVAIRNAKVVTVSGPVINRGTVVVRKGLIEAVGENVQIPADAMVVEGEGLTVYPGLVDGLSTWGIPGAAGWARGDFRGRPRRPREAAASRRWRRTRHRSQSRLPRGVRRTALRRRVGLRRPTRYSQATGASNRHAAPALRRL